MGMKVSANAVEQLGQERELEESGIAAQTKGELSLTKQARLVRLL
jgi:hypothetical protein